MAKKQTFAQYLINKTLPADLSIDKPMSGAELKRVLTDVYNRYPDKYGQVVSALKRLGDTFSTYEGITIGLDEIAVPNKEKRDAIISTHTKLFEKAKTDEERGKVLADVQAAIVANDTDGGKDDATLMVVSGGLGGKRNQLVKLRSTPTVVKDHAGNLVPEIFTKSYSEGQQVLNHWLQAAESRRNLVEGQLSTASPGEMNKVISNLLSSTVVSTDDCGTRQGVLLFTKDQDVLDRYLAAPAGRYNSKTLVTPEVQAALLRQGIERILVRSPQTCEAKDGTVCSFCMGLSNSTGKRYSVGTNVGMISAGSISEPLTQLTLSAKHSTTMAKKETGLVGEKGFRAFVEQPKQYPNRKVYCEVYGKITRILPAPQGGRYITIRQTRPVPDRYIENAQKSAMFKNHWEYFIPPQRKLIEGIEVDTEVYPGMELTDGNDHLRDIARLKNLGIARSMAAEGMRNIYRRTGQDVDRRHFEMLARNMMNHVKLEKVPPGFPYKRGEVVDYNALCGAIGKVTSRSIGVDNALGMTLTAPVNEFTVGTELTSALVAKLKADGVRTVRATSELEVSPVVAPLTRAFNQTTDFIPKLNHRYLKTTIQDAATTGQRSKLHGYSPITAYAYGVEMGKGKDGTY